MRLKFSGRPDPPCCPAALPCPSNPPSPARGLQTEEAKQKQTLQKQTLQKQDDKQAKNKRNTVMKSHQKKVGSGLKANTPCFVCGISSDLGFSVQIFALANVFFSQFSDLGASMILAGLYFTSVEREWFV